jgi:hypothetical protein
VNKTALTTMILIAGLGMALIATVGTSSAQHRPMSLQWNESCYGQDVRCPDGHYHGPDGSVQPDRCDNGFKNEHPCKCEVSQDETCDPKAHAKPGKMCKTNCREKACSCLSMCPS